MGRMGLPALFPPRAKQCLRPGPHLWKRHFERHQPATDPTFSCRYVRIVCSVYRKNADRHHFHSLGRWRNV